MGIANVEDPGGLRYTMSWRQLFRWIAFRTIDQFGSQREDYRAGIVAAAVVNGIGSLAAGFAGQRNYKPVGPLDFFEPREVQPVQSMKTVTNEKNEKKSRTDSRDWKNWKSALKSMGRPRT